jgi:biopolymer transport protein TolR
MSDVKLNPQINVSRIPLGSGIGGALAALACMLIILLGLPELWYFVPVPLALGCGVALVLHFIRHKNPGEPWILPATRIRDYRQRCAYRGVSGSTPDVPTSAEHSEPEAGGTDTELVGRSWRQRRERGGNMKSVIEAGLVGSILIAGAGALYSQQPPLKQGIAVDMPVAGHAVEMRAADEQNATVVAMTADGRVFVGVKPIEPEALSRLSERTVYLKADVRAPYQKVLAVLDALRGKSVVLLSAPPENAVRQGYAPPYGTKLIVSR